MNDLLELFEKSSNAFYLGQDENGWTYFSKIIELIQFHIANEQLDVNFKSVLMEFIIKNDDIVKLKKQKNYPLLGDLLRTTYKKLEVTKKYN